MAVKLNGVTAYTNPSNGLYSTRFQTPLLDSGGCVLYNWCAYLMLNRKKSASSATASISACGVLRNHLFVVARIDLGFEVSVVVLLAANHERDFGRGVGEREQLALEQVPVKLVVLGERLDDLVRDVLWRLEVGQLGHSASVQQQERAHGKL
ncbi:hypothetical protein OGATHE_003789 [Ogataea polymorpha]|uniref:Uncharacterized protein n=1 Tax=Ogataea polymorpha TaxID=460523 RepID=A0A9P8P4N7_9ASCO|nr:hypothetical protein OGATHE_003789 [Ogataea polymorpha]